jgi:hypothetical protein
VAAAMAALHAAVHGLAADYQAVMPAPPAPVANSRQLPAHLVQHVAEVGGATKVRRSVWGPWGAWHIHQMMHGYAWC